MKAPAAVLLLIPLALSPLTALAAPGGELDATFSDNGRLIMVGQWSGTAVVQQPADGKLLIAGSSPANQGTEVITVLRLNADGSRDGSFGDQGVATIAFGDGGSSATALALQADGTIVVAGTSNPGNGVPAYLAVARLNQDGTLDTSFDDDGRATVDVAGTPVDVAVEQDGGLLIAAWIGDSFALIRLIADGTPDFSFSTNPVPGMRVVPLGSLFPSSTWGATGLARLADGAYIVCGADWIGDDWWYTGNMGAIRILADASLDSGFGDSGIWQLEADENVDSGANGCVVTADGSIVLAGHRDFSPILVKLRSDGVVDSTAWEAGTLRLDAYGTADSIVELADGDLAVFGTFNGPDVGQYIGRIDPATGSFDPAFGEDGVTVIDFGLDDQRPYLSSHRLLEQGDGKLVAVAVVQYMRVAFATNWVSGDAALALARVDPNGPGSNGVVGFTSALSFATEGDTPEATVPVQRTGGSAGLFVVDYATRAGTAGTSDFRATTGTLVWADGELERKTISVRIASDFLGEPTESFQIELLNSSGALAQRVTKVAIDDPEEQPKPPVYTQGGGSGAFGMEVLLLLVVGSVAALRRIGRRGRALAALALLAATGAARAQVNEREGTWDLGLTFVDGGDASFPAPAGTSISLKGNGGWGVWGSYHFANRLAIGFEWSQLTPDIETNLAVDPGPSGSGSIVTLRHEGEIENLHVKGSWNFLKKDFSPFVEVGLGWSRLASGIDAGAAAGLDPLWVDWYDPWWGLVWHPSAIPGRYEHTNTTVTYAAGVRWDISDRLTARADYAGLEGLDVSAVTGSADVESIRLGFGWRF